MDRGVAEVNRHGIPAMFFLHLFDAPGGFIQCLSPADFFPAGCRLSHGFSQAVRTLMKDLEGFCLGADVSSTESIVLVRPYGWNLIPFRNDFEAAHGLTDIT